MCQNSSTAHIDLWPFLTQRYFLWVFSSMLRLSVACSLTLVSLSECDLAMRRLWDGQRWYISGLTLCFTENTQYFQGFNIGRKNISCLYMPVCLHPCVCASATDMENSTKNHSLLSPRPPRWPSGKATALRAEDPGFKSRLHLDFFGSSHTSLLLLVRQMEIPVSPMKVAVHRRSLRLPYSLRAKGVWSGQIPFLSGS